MELKRELLYYVIFGILTTLVNIGVYFLFARVFGIYYIVSNIVAWVLSVLFAYVTNRIWVFESRNSNILKEMAMFFSARLSSGIIDTVLMFIFIDVLFLGDFISKIVIQVIVVVLNYLFSKFLVFKN